LPVVEHTAGSVLLHWKNSSIGRRLAGITEKHTELRLFGETTNAFDHDRFVAGLKWLSKEVAPCVGGCRGGWKGCPFRKCCGEKGLSFCYDC
jgi:hypothetical protein